MCGADLLGLQFWALVVVEVVVEIAITHAKLELLKDGLVVHEVQGIEHVTAQLQTDRRTNIHHTRIHPFTVDPPTYTFC